MTLTTRQRWTGYALAAAATGVAMWAVDLRTGGDGEVVAAVAPARPTAPADTSPDAPRPEPGVIQRSNANAIRSVPADARHGDAPVVDPFGAPDWERKAALRAFVPAAPPVRPPPPTAPPVPYVYMGRWIEDGAAIAVLDRDGQPSFAHVHDTVDGVYRVEAIDESQLVLTYLPMRTRQVVSAGAEPGVAPQAATGAAATTAAAANPPRVEGGPSSSGSADSQD